MSCMAGDAGVVFAVVVEGEASMICGCEAGDWGAVVAAANDCSNWACSTSGDSWGRLIGTCKHSTGADQFLTSHLLYIGLNIFYS
jgi:hypothetical protein